MAEHTPTLADRLRDPPMANTLQHPYCYDTGATDVLMREAANSIDALVKALEFFADGNNWKLNGRCDPNSPRFDGIQVAETALAKAKS